MKSKILTLAALATLPFAAYAGSGCGSCSGEKASKATYEKASKSDSGVTIEGANVVQPDVWASNGVIHVIDQVILPGDA